MTLTQTYDEGDLVEVVNPHPTGSRGVVVSDRGGSTVTVRWTGNREAVGHPLRNLLRPVDAERRKQDALDKLQTALSYAVDDTRALVPGSVSEDYAALVSAYCSQITTAVADVTSTGNGGST